MCFYYYWDRKARIIGILLTLLLWYVIPWCSLWAWNRILPGNGLNDMNLSKCEAQTFFLVPVQTTENHSMRCFCVEKYRIRYLPFTGGKYQFARWKDSVPCIPDRLQRHNRVIWTVAGFIQCLPVLGNFQIVSSLYHRFPVSMILLWWSLPVVLVHSHSSPVSVSEKDAGMQKHNAGEVFCEYFVPHHLQTNVSGVEHRTPAQTNKTYWPTHTAALYKTSAFMSKAVHTYSILNNDFSGASAAALRLFCTTTTTTATKLRTLTHLSLLFPVSQWPSSVPVSLTVSCV